MERIKGRYVAQVVLEFDVPREDGMKSLEEIRHHICDGDMKIALTEILSDGMMDGCIVTVDQQYADVYNVNDENEAKQKCLIN